jgi:DNA-binding IclR family transcriptional regulator
MKSYKLTAWPDLPAAFRHVQHARMLMELSQRHITEAGLQQATGLALPEVRRFVQHLNSLGLLEMEEVAPPPWQHRLKLKFSSWLRRA